MATQPPAVPRTAAPSSSRLPPQADGPSTEELLRAVDMRYFSRASGCRLAAEGVETEAEAKTLSELGVEFGQGHHFGAPQAAPR